MLSAILFIALSAESFIEFELGIEAIKSGQCLQDPFFKQLYSDYEEATFDFARTTAKCDDDFPVKIPDPINEYDVAIGIKQFRNRSACRSNAFARRLYTVAALQAYLRSHLPENCTTTIRERANFLANTKFKLEPMLFLAPNAKIENLIKEIRQKEE
jgi:hypothetical protein